MVYWLPLKRRKLVETEVEGSSHTKDPLLFLGMLVLICRLIAGLGANGSKPRIDQHSLPPSAKAGIQSSRIQPTINPLFQILRADNSPAETTDSTNLSNLATRWEGRRYRERPLLLYSFVNHSHLSVILLFIHSKWGTPYCKAGGHLLHLHAIADPHLAILHKGPFPPPCLYFETSTRRVDSCQVQSLLLSFRFLHQHSVRPHWFEDHIGQRHSGEARKLISVRQPSSQPANLAISPESAQPDRFPRDFLYWCYHRIQPALSCRLEDLAPCASLSVALSGTARGSDSNPAPAT